MGLVHARPSAVDLQTEVSQALSPSPATAAQPSTGTLTSDERQTESASGI